jgi:hypothetical protein
MVSTVKVDTISERAAGGGVTIDGVLVKDGVATFQTAAGSPLVFEGATADAFETTFAITDPTADRTITFPDASITLGASGTNAPAFEAYLSANQVIASSATLTKVLCNTETFDSDSAYDNSSNYRFTPGVVGKYYVTCQIQMENSLGDNISDAKIAIYKNGSVYRENAILGGNHVYYSPGNYFTMQNSAIMDLNATDYIEMWGAQEEIASSTKWFGIFTGKATYFSAYKMIGI